MLTLIVMAIACGAFGYYLRVRGGHMSPAEAGLLAVLAGGVWTWFLAFRLSAGGLFAGGGAIVWTIVLAAICVSVIRRAVKQHTRATVRSPR